MKRQVYFLHSLICLIIFYFLLSVTPSVVAQKNNDQLKTIILHNINDSPNIDGILDEKVWMTAAKFGVLIQREPNNGNSVSEETNVYIYYDDNNLYFGFDCRYSDAANIVATEMRRD